MKHITAAFLAAVLLFSGCCRCDCDCNQNTEPSTAESAVSNTSDSTESVTYSVDTLLTEEVTEGDLKRKVCVLELRTTSQYNMEIYNTITYYALEQLNNYMQVPYAYQQLTIDSYAAEKNGILCATVLIGKEPTSGRWIRSQNVYLDLENDRLLPYREAAKLVGLDVSKAEAAAEKLKKGQNCASYDNSSDTYEVECFYFYDDKAYFVIQTTLYMDATYRVTYLYEYDTDTYFCATEGYGGMQNIYRDT